ncbi:MAG TPA: flippase [Bacteroidota bacterium]|nr:flippase [Bacteroidota bacterium]
MNNSIAHSVAKNTAIQFAQQLMTWASTFLLMLFLPRYLGPVSYGHLYLAITVSGIFLLFIDYDNRLGISKRIAKTPEDAARIIANSYAFRVGIWIVSFISLMVFGMVAGYPPVLRWILLLFGVEMLWNGGKTVLLGLFLGFESLKYSSIGAIIERAFIAIVGVSALLLGANEIVIAAIMISGTLIDFLILLKFSHRFVPKLARVDWKQTIVLLKDGFPYLLYTLFGVIYYRIDTVMLSVQTPEAVVGWYGVSYKFLDLLAFLPSIFSLSLLPVMTKLQSKGDDRTEVMTRKGLDFIMVAVFPITICMFALSHDIIKLFYGLTGFGPSVILLQLLSVGLPLIYIDMVLGTAIFACDKQRQWAVTAFFAAILNIVLNYFLIPYFQVRAGNGAIGASIATIITEFFILLNALALLPAKLLPRDINLVSVKSVTAGIVMAGSIWLMNQAGLYWLAQPVIATALYFGCLLLMKTFTPEEITFMKQFMSIGNITKIFSMGRSGGE